MANNKYFPKKLDELMTKDNLANSVLAKKIGIDYNTAYSYRIGRRYPSILILRKIADILNVDQKELMTPYLLDKHEKDMDFIDKFDVSKATFADVVLYTRIINGYTMEEMAEVVGVSNETIRGHECGYNLPNLSNAKEYYKHLPFDKDDVGKILDRDSYKYHKGALSNGVLQNYSGTYREYSIDDFTPIDISKMTMGEIIDTRLSELNMTRTELAKMIGVNRVTLTNWRKNKSQFCRLPLLANAFKLNIYELLQVYLKEYIRSNPFQNGLYLLRFCVCSCLGMSRQKFCETFNISMTSLTNFELDKERLCDIQMGALEDALGIDADTILALKEVYGTYAGIESYLHEANMFILRNYIQVKDDLPESVVEQIMEGY